MIARVQVVLRTRSTPTITRTSGLSVAVASVPKSGQDLDDTGALELRSHHSPDEFNSMTLSSPLEADVIHWLVVTFDSSRRWPEELGTQQVELLTAKTVESIRSERAYRASPIFPLHEESCSDVGRQFYVTYYTFDPAFKAIGNINKHAPQEIRCRSWVSAGLASLVLISEKAEDSNLLEQAAGFPPQAREQWSVEDGTLVHIDFYLAGVNAQQAAVDLSLPDYSSLPVSFRAALDEFTTNLDVILPQIRVHIPSELDSFAQLTDRVRVLAKELVYIQAPRGLPPRTLREYTAEQLRNEPLLRATIAHQAMDRIVQINAALAYVSTQSLSGAIPILERRSIIRRHSLLGVGSAVTALTRIARSIEQAFASTSIETLITERMTDRPLLPGLNLPSYDTSRWGDSSVNRWADQPRGRPHNAKLPYYSGRLGFRETEFTISAALQSLVAGAGLEWSLLTITHEMLHGHVRGILTSVFQGDPDMEESTKRRLFYERYKVLTTGNELADGGLLDSLRHVVFAYCSLVRTHGSLTKYCPDLSLSVNERDTGAIREITRGYYLLGQDALWTGFEQEYRNISEIFVHVLDLFYFYGGRLGAYIPLIWSSWGTVPHVHSNLRHYVLRSLLAITSKERLGSAKERFDLAVSRLVEILEGVKHLEHGIFRSVTAFVEDEQSINEVFFPFSASLVLVDLVTDIFRSDSIRAQLLDDPRISWRSTETGFEEQFVYDLPTGFPRGTVQRPAALLLHRMLLQLEENTTGEVDSRNVEHQSVELFLACGSTIP